jgi:phage terminase large subunit
MYSYKTDSLTGVVMPVLEDKNNHVIDALRYACEAIRKAPQARERKEIRHPHEGGWLG